MVDDSTCWKCFLQFHHTHFRRLCQKQIKPAEILEAPQLFQPLVRYIRLIQVKGGKILEVLQFLQPFVCYLRFM